MGNLFREIEQLKILFDKYGLMNVSTYAKKTSVSRMTVYRWLNSDKIDYLTLGGIKYIVTKNGNR